VIGGGGPGTGQVDGNKDQDRGGRDEKGEPAKNLFFHMFIPRVKSFICKFKKYILSIHKKILYDLIIIEKNSQ